MSMSAEMRIELQRQVQEQLRLQQVRAEARALVEQCTRTLAATEQVEVQQLAREGLLQLRDETRGAKSRIDAEPDVALAALEALPGRIHAVIGEARQRAEAWSDEQARVRVRLAELADRVGAARSGSGNAAVQGGFGPVQAELDLAEQLGRAGRNAEALAACDRAEQALEPARRSALGETTRREVVRGLIELLRKLGFVVQPAKRSVAADTGDLVRLVGRLPSGRQATFEVSLDGQLGFDLHGYEGRTCGKELERVTALIVEHCQADVGPPQVVWKNPDRLSRGARDLPGGGNSAQRGGAR